LLIVHLNLSNRPVRAQTPTLLCTQLTQIVFIELVLAIQTTKE
jgi:hypothetical protein